MFEIKGNYRDLRGCCQSSPAQTGNGSNEIACVPGGNNQFKMATKHELEKNSQIVPKAYRKWNSLLLGATAKSNMVAKHEIEDASLKACPRQQEMEFMKSMATVRKTI